VNTFLWTAKQQGSGSPRSSTWKQQEAGGWKEEVRETPWAKAIPWICHHLQDNWNSRPQVCSYLITSITLYYWRNL